MLFHSGPRKPEASAADFGAVARSWTPDPATAEGRLQQVRLPTSVSTRPETTIRLDDAARRWACPDAAQSRPQDGAVLRRMQVHAPSWARICHRRSSTGRFRRVFHETSLCCLSGKGRRLTAVRFRKPLDQQLARRSLTGYRPRRSSVLQTPFRRWEVCFHRV